MKPDGAHFTDYWLAEWLRLREAHWGPLEDAREVRQARAQGRTFAQRIVLRARFLCEREKLDTVPARWWQGARLILPALGLLAILAGSGAALGALGNGIVPVNIALALTAMLGLHCLTYLLWLASFALHGHAEGGAQLGRLWLWLTRKLARGPDAALVPRALTGLLNRNGSLRWLLGSVSHGLWTVAFTSLLLTMLAVLSARRYDFGWQTTLLTPDTFVHLAALLGWAPAHLGFATPPADIVRASNGLHTLPDTARALWSNWLMGCVVVYGLLPRLLGLVLCLAMTRYRIRRLDLDVTLPGYADLRQRLVPSSEVTGIDKPDTDIATGPGFATHPSSPIAGRPAIAGIELPHDQPWPPVSLDARIVDLGVVDSRPQRQATLERLQHSPPSRLLVVCDARQTPDRGAVALIAELAADAGATMVALTLPANDTPTPQHRAGQWRDRLVDAGLASDLIVEDTHQALSWLTTPPGASNE
ncbi:MAG TPA: DUF2868 domain-containing protein [Burkholderiaceae bacterium]|nr:DUF2868 domain-containing protein [Burkholderiaceae bacterium]